MIVVPLETHHDKGRHQMSACIAHPLDIHTLSAIHSYIVTEDFPLVSLFVAMRTRLEIRGAQSLFVLVYILRSTALSSGEKSCIALFKPCTCKIIIIIKKLPNVSRHVLDEVVSLILSLALLQLWVGFVPMATESRLAPVRGPVPHSYSGSGEVQLPEAFTSIATHFTPHHRDQWSRLWGVKPAPWNGCWRVEQLSRHTHCFHCFKIVTITLVVIDVVVYWRSHIFRQSRIFL